ncbi:MAG: NAD-binding protein [Dyadobacter sp.]
MNRWLLFKKFFSPLVYLGFLTLVGTFGYVIIEDYRWLDSLYMTIITISTVGYGEVNRLSDAGRIFTILLIVSSVGLVAYYLALVTRLLADGEWSKEYQQFRQRKYLQKMDNHVVVCGYGRNGRQACEILRQNDVAFAVIESTKVAAPHPGDVIIYADATRDEVLIEAGILKAKAIIISLPDDAANLFIVLTARQLNPSIVIISRASYDQSVNKLKIAGATNVIMPDKLGGAHMASLVLIPDVQEFISLISSQHNDKFQITEIEIHNSIHLGQLNLWQQTGCTVLGVKLLNGKYHRNPEPAYVTTPGEGLLLMGSSQQIQDAVVLLG